ncbi:hypothetical protein [Streptomyces sp. BK79]|uniref:hypothetical protein n=1 Tax=Streptomyces sp. BK79 TaxID=3350097 RepID=UPI00376F6F92
MSWSNLSAGLSQALTLGFAEPAVEIDAACHTGEALSLALGEPIRFVHVGTLRPARVSLRLMLPSRDIDLAFPTTVDGTENAELHSRWLSSRNAHGQTIRHNLMSLRTTHGIEVHVQVRALPFTPMAQLYVVNRTTVLFSYSMITRRGAEPPISADIYDAATNGVETLGTFQAGMDNDRETTFVEQSQLWFDSVWNTISTELSLS